MRSKQGWRHLTSAISHLATSICLLFGWWPGTVNWAEQLLCIFLAALFPPAAFSSFCAAFSNVRSFSSKSTVNAIRWRAGSIFTFEPIGVTVVAGSSFTRAACNSRASIVSSLKLRISSRRSSFRTHACGSISSGTRSVNAVSNDNSVPWLIGQITGDAQRKRYFFHLSPSATFLLSLARTATPARSTFTSISREAGQDYGTVVVGWPLNSHPWWIESSHEYARYFYFVSGTNTRVSVWNDSRDGHFIFFLRYSRASPPRYITFVWSFFGLSNGFATLRGVHSARKETWCSGKSRKSRKSGSLYSVQRVGSVVVLFHSRCTCPIWGREKIYYTVLRYQIVRGKKLKIYEKVNLSLKMIRTRVIW